MKLFSDGGQDKIARKNCGANRLTSLMSTIMTRTMIDPVNMSVMYGRGTDGLFMSAQLHRNVVKVTDYLHVCQQ